MSALVGCNILETVNSHDLSCGVVMQVHPTVSRQQAPGDESDDEAVSRYFCSHRVSDRKSLSCALFSLMNEQ